MRTIEFRGQRIENQEWVFGYYYSECGNPYIIEDCQKETLLNRNTPHLINPETLGQYTGLKDNNNVKIYEGDIILIFDMFKHEVVFKNGSYGYMVDDGFVSFSSNKSNLGASYANLDKVKVIGNIHQNPELLKS